MNGRITTVLAVAGLLLGFGVARYSNAAPSDSTINGCFNNITGAVRVLTSGGDSCEAGKETALSWNSSQPSTRWFRDHDGDGYGDWYRFVDSPAQPPGYVSDNTDCDDNRAASNPGEKSDPGPGDANCNGVEAENRQITWYRDADGDGWGATAHTVKASMSAQPFGYVYRYGDCDDHDASVHPYQTKCQHDGDVDGDGFRGTANGGDCNDADSREHVGATEVTDPYGHDEDCAHSTGGVVPYDPDFLDLRPHVVHGFMEQAHFGLHGQLIPGDSVDVTTPLQPCPFTGGCGIWSTPPLYTN